MEDLLLQRPLYVYDLPSEILSSLVSKDDPTPEPQLETSAIPSASSDVPATKCTVCGYTGYNVDEQRAHVRSDLHKLNMKRRIRGQRILNEAEFEERLADIDEAESISGSEYNSESDELGPDGEVNRDLARKRRGANPNSNLINSDDYDDGPDGGVSLRSTQKTPVVWFKSSIFSPTVSLGIYRAILPPSTAPSEVPSYLARKQLTPTTKPLQNPPHFFFCMIGGGHFAAMIISLVPQPGTKGERNATVLAHKTFHRYTTRRKQGGAQSANDAAKGNAHSAGSTLRRYNEAELNKDIRELLASWKEQWINTAELLFIRAAGTTNRRTIFHYEGAVINPKDSRIRGFPFSTRRATQSELMRAFGELTRVKISRVSEASLTQTRNNPSTLSNQYRNLSLNPTPSSPGPKNLKPTAAERQLLDHTSTITSLIRRSKVPPLLSYLSANSLSPNFPFYPPQQHFHAPTPLHFAASLNAAPIISALLTKSGADPTITNEEGKTPWEFASDRPTRDAFRLARAELGERRWDWSRAKVGNPLTQQDIAERTRKEDVERWAREEREKERRVKEVARLKKEEAERELSERRNQALRTGGGGVKLGSAAGGQHRLRTGDDLGREREVAGMTPETRMRLDRERRARAAEARIKAMQGGGAGN